MAFLYKILAILGLMSLGGAILQGFRYEPMAAHSNLYFNIGLYGAFIFVHLFMTMPAFKKAVFGSAKGSLRERQVYILVTVITWWALLWFHKPIGGMAVDLPVWVHFLGYSIALFGFFLFFETMDMVAIRQFLGVPGEDLSHSTGGETPLMTEGSYAAVRHPMYRGAMILGAGGLLIHPNMGQLVFTALIGLTFILFIPVEERLLIKARGDQYLDYRKAVPYRLLRGIW